MLIAAGIESAEGREKQYVIEISGNYFFGRHIFDRMRPLSIAFGDHRFYLLIVQQSEGICMEFEEESVLHGHGTIYDEWVLQLDGFGGMDGARCSWD